MGVRQSQEDPGCALPALTLYQEADRKLSRALHKDCRLRSLRWGWRVHSHPTHSPASTSLAQRVGIKQDPLGDEQRDRLQKLGRRAKERNGNTSQHRGGDRHDPAEKAWDQTPGGFSRPRQTLRSACSHGVQPPGPLPHYKSMPQIACQAVGNYGQVTSTAVAAAAAAHTLQPRCR